MTQTPRQDEFRARLRDKDRLIGTFVKTPHASIVEVLAGSGLDFAVLDAEHGPFDAAGLDQCLLAARAGDFPVLVRVPALAPSPILQALDLGAVGTLVPHVTTAEEAETAARLTHYGEGGRGFSNSPRAGDYGKIGLGDHLARAEGRSTVLCQMEDPAAVEAAMDIARVDAVDGLFIGRADLAVAYGCAGLEDKKVADAVDRVCAAATAADRSLGMFIAPGADLGPFEERGITLFAVGSDHGLMRQGAQALLD